MEAASNKDDNIDICKIREEKMQMPVIPNQIPEKIQAAQQKETDVSEIASEALPSIVSITTKSVQEVQNYFGNGNVWNVWICATAAGTGSRVVVPVLLLVRMMMNF